MDVLVIIQARISSTRLPAKVMLPIAGRPSAVLAAQRAANRGLAVCVAISQEKSDDLLCARLREHSIMTVRGPLHDVLRRFTLAASALSDDSVVVRLTADNVFPDGIFLEELIDRFLQQRQIYWGTQSPADRLPYGVSAEVFTAGALRLADRRAAIPFEREHVTPWLKKQWPAAPFTPLNLAEDLSHLRCTIDSLADYDQVARLFEDIRDPVMVPWTELCKRLRDSAPVQRVPRNAGHGRSQITLGTAQIGIPNYGRANITGRPSRDAAIALVREAVNRGVNSIDTARAYETAESVIGEALQIYGDQVTTITKLAPMDDLPEGVPEGWVTKAVDASVFRSCRELRLSAVPVLLLHRWKHRHSHGGAVWRRVLELRSEGYIKRIGASVSSAAEAAEALADGNISHLQLPFNILDFRWRDERIDSLANERPDVVIDVRSVLLQGILPSHAELWPNVLGLVSAEVIGALDGLARRLGRKNRTDLCLAFVRAQRWIDSLVLGVETVGQLDDLIAHFQEGPLSDEEVELAIDSVPRVPEMLLNPARWPSK